MPAPLQNKVVNRVGESTCAIGKMPPHRIKLAHTIEFKMKTVEEYLSSAETRVGFCKGRDFSRSTLSIGSTSTTRCKWLSRTRGAPRS
jgi:hypothetical protein